jgi:hypothetical protein
VAVVLGLGHAHRLLEVLVRQLRVDDLVALLRQERRLDAARDRLPAVQEEDLHGVVVARCGRPGWACLSPEEYLGRACPGGRSLPKMTRSNTGGAAVAKKNMIRGASVPVLVHRSPAPEGKTA